MKHPRGRFFFGALLIILGWIDAQGFANDSSAAGIATPDKPEADTGQKHREPKVFVKEFSGTFNGERVPYVVTAGETFLKNENDEDMASVFSVAYVRRRSSDASNRPVTFVFNGGPGAASLWLHMGLFGPKHVVLPSNATSAGAPPYVIEDNPLSILDVSDLVFIDPVGTGYSTSLGKAKLKDFWGLKEDAKSIAEFIRVWITKNGRWNSPRYIAGESYGCTRAAQLVGALQGGFTGISVNGVILISGVLDFHTRTFQKGNDLPFLGYLPTYAAVALYHGKIAPKPENVTTFLAEVRHFAVNEYSVALLKGSAITVEQRAATIEALARYTGLSPLYLDHADMRVSALRFMKELLRDKDLTIGRLDARYTGQDYDAAGEIPDNDPSAYGVIGAFVAASNDYLTRTIGVDLDRRYKVLDDEPSDNWKWIEPNVEYATYTNVAPLLGTAMRENNDFRVFMANGYYDLAAPFFASEMTVVSNGIPTNRVTIKNYEAGHMIYTHRPSREALASDVRAFIRQGS